ncbi:MAG: OmpA family protein [Ignavibacteria bacterium]|nr:OmpA family protein [Ignavibacteria bacterium]
MVDNFFLLYKAKCIRFILAILCYFSSISYVFSQNETEYNLDSLIEVFSTKPKFGAFGSLGLNLHLTNFKQLPEIPCCSPKFPFGSSFGWEFGGVGDYYLKDFIFLSGKVSILQNNAYFSKEEPTTVIIDGVSQEGVFEHRLDTWFNYLNLEFSANYSSNYFIWYSGGLGLSFPLKYSFHQKEVIVKPEDRGTFNNGLRVRNEYAGNIKDVRGIIPFLSFGVSAELPAHKRNLFFLYPEIYAKYYFISPIRGVSWNSIVLRLGLAVKFREPIPPPPPPPPPKEPPIYEFPAPIEPPTIMAKISYRVYDSSGYERKNVPIRVEDFVSYNMKPLLNYIFFDHNSDIIPNRYIKFSPEKARNFSLSELSSLDVLQTYYYVLNIIGKKLQQSKESKVLLVGTNSGKGEEKNNLDLSYRRAKAIKDYLINVWGIEEHRIDIESRNLPKEPSNPDDPQGDEENRRVEIITDDLRILEPVFSVDTLRKVEKMRVVFYPVYQSGVDLKKWTISVKQNGETVKLFEGNGKPPDSLIWEIDDRGFDKIVFGGKLDVDFFVVDYIDQTGRAKAEPLMINKITVDKKRMEGVTDREYEFYSLILFDFGKSKLEREHKNVLEFLYKRVTSNSQVTIEGFTDNIGDEKINKKISEKRAIEVAKWLGLKNAKTVGVGESYLLYDNSLPEGRFYCRTVRITIETPINVK